MSLLTVVKDVCAVVGIPIPQAVLSNITANRTMQEMLSLANEMANRIAYDNRDWSVLKLFNTFTGDGTKTSFPLPANYKRMLLTTNVWRSTSALCPMNFISDTDEWLQRRMLNYTYPFGEWTLLGNQMLLWPAMGPAVTATFSYLDGNCITLASGGVGNTFAADTDSFRLDERLLKLGMIWQWKANKGSPYAEDMANYSDALAMVQGHDKPSPIMVGRRPMPGGVRAAYPWPVPT
jgi:hypothetical protein